jgi:decaprenylphospho-beta-D-erythro-pentofuranosid-2-ulose 2-reductase
MGPRQRSKNVLVGAAPLAAGTILRCPPYGSTKAGLDAFATGLGDDLAGTEVGVVDATDAIAAAVGGHSGTAWVPDPMRRVISVLRHLPPVAFRRLPI